MDDIHQPDSDSKARLRCRRRVLMDPYRMFRSMCARMAPKLNAFREHFSPRELPDIRTDAYSTPVHAIFGRRLCTTIPRYQMKRWERCGVDLGAAQQQEVCVQARAPIRSSLVFRLRRRHTNLPRLPYQPGDFNYSISSSAS